MTLSPTMRDCLRALRHRAAKGHEPLPQSLPGGLRTVRALQARGLAVYEGGRTKLTDAGRR